MVKVYEAQALHQAQYVKSLLAEQGIPCFLKNEFTTNMLPIVQDSTVWPEVHVEAKDEGRALQIIEKHLNQPAREPWSCPSCTEAIEGEFNSCWNCGEDRPS